jgi:hypothetical protein
MKKVSYILVVIAIGMIMFGIIFQYVDYKCKTIDKNTDFWVRNCDYK